MTDQNPPPPDPSSQREPLPGEQYPAAILPQTGYNPSGTAQSPPSEQAPAQPPSGPFPAQPLPSDPFAAQPPSGPFPAQPPPGDPIAVQPPSGPFPAQSLSSDPFGAQALPAAGNPFPPPGPPPPQFAAQPRKPANKPAIILAIVAAMFIVATGVLGALFIVEQGDHQSTSGELRAVREELKTAQDKATYAAVEMQKTIDSHRHMKLCWESTRKYLRAPSDEEAKPHWDKMLDAC